MKKETIVIIGLGYVGLPLALLADKKGYEVIGIDKDVKKVKLVNEKKSPIEGEAYSEELKKASIKATDDYSKIKKVSIIIICVPTPVFENYLPNLGPLKNACEEISKNLQKGQLVILESTVNPGVSEEIAQPILEESGLKAGKDFYIVHCPERINPGDKKWTVENIPRVVGALSEKGLEKALKFYKSIISAEIKPMNNIKEAEAVKIVENSFRDINIAFVNELAMSFSKLNIDLVNVIDGAATKPFAFMPHYPGCGVGGHCIPVDPYYLIAYAKKVNNFSHDFLITAREVNKGMPKFTVDKLIEELKKKNIKNKDVKVAVLGLSYKPDVADDRESPSYSIIENLEKAGLKTETFDPYIIEKSTKKSLKEAISGVKAIIIATSHKEFLNIKPEELKKIGVEVVIDGRNCLDKDKFKKAGLIYIGIGR